mmetsp:Transcript_30560/g.62342  ORF Transcript_30560/g.62342 Transcript_30560/m.62342 type:complete len:253 (-) Transcript_30560:19-777(-)
MTWLIGVMNSLILTSISSSACLPSLNPADITRSRSLEVVMPTTRPLSLDESVVVSARSTTIIPDRPRSIQTKIASWTVASLLITGSTHRRVCFILRTSDMGTSDIFWRRFGSPVPPSPSFRRLSLSFSSAARALSIWFCSGGSTETSISLAALLWPLPLVGDGAVEKAAPRQAHRKLPSWFGTSLAGEEPVGLPAPKSPEIYEHDLRNRRKDVDTAGRDPRRMEDDAIMHIFAQSLAPRAIRPTFASQRDDE